MTCYRVLDLTGPTCLAAGGSRVYEVVRSELGAGRDVVLDDGHVTPVGLRGEENKWH